MASITSSSDVASAWMSSRSIGVTNVRIEALDDLVGQAVALLLDLLDLERRVPGRRVRREHPFEQRGPRHDAIGQGDEIVEKLLFLGDESKLEHAASMAQACYGCVNWMSRLRSFATSLTGGN